MGKVQTDQIATQLASESGQPLTASKGMLGGAATEFGLRQKMGQLGANAMTPYQEAQLGISQQNANTASGNLESLRRARQAQMDKDAATANKNATKPYLDHINDTLAYQKDAKASYHKLLDAKTPEEFETHKEYLTAINESAFKRGIREEKLQAIPQSFVPPSEEPLPAGIERYPSKSVYSPGAGFIQQRGTGIPAGAIPVPKLEGQPAGVTGKYNGRPYIWDGNFMVPDPNR